VNSPPTSTRGQLRRTILSAILAILVQAALGIVVNLYVTVPAHHSGARPSNYFVGSFDSVVWAIAHGATGLAIHAVLGLLLALMVIRTAVEAVRVRGAIAAWSALAAALVVGAGFNGASFLDFGSDTSSLIMALLAFAAIGCYAVVLFLLSDDR